jgi:hypothetical protein
MPAGHSFTQPYGLGHLEPSHRRKVGGQVSQAREADHVEKLGVNRAVGLCLVAAWLIVLVCTVVFRCRTDYNTHRELHWWEAFYRTGSIIFGGGQVFPMVACAPAAALRKCCWLTNRLL